MSQKIYGLIGRTLGHSWSVPIHVELGNPDYRLIELEPEELSQFLADPAVAGLNVTIPYKRDVMAHCEHLSTEAQAIGAVNTIVRDASGKLTGHNTDAYGFTYLLDNAGIDLAGEKVLIFGSGGASATVQWAARDRGASEVVVVSRSGLVTYEDLHHHRDAAVLVNATPLGMFPDVKRYPVDPAEFTSATAAVDLIYNPLRSTFLQKAKAAGMKTADGLDMLVAQAVRAEELFFNTEISRQEVNRISGALRRDMQNIVLVGMPGSGKSTIGALLGEISGRPVLDTDQLVEDTAGMSIPEIFAKHGELHFRELEYEAVVKAAAERGVILVTGGGSVLREDNRLRLRHSGRAYHLSRDILKLPRDGRPLSEDADLRGMYQERKPFYEAASDVVVENDSDPTEVAAVIWREFRENPSDQRA